MKMNIICRTVGLVCVMLVTNILLLAEPPLSVNNCNNWKNSGPNNGLFRRCRVVNPVKVIWPASNGMPEMSTKFSASWIQGKSGDATKYWTKQLDPKRNKALPALNYPETKFALDTVQEFDVDAPANAAFKSQLTNSLFSFGCLSGDGAMWVQRNMPAPYYAAAPFKMNLFYAKCEYLSYDTEVSGSTYAPSLSDPFTNSSNIYNNINDGFLWFNNFHNTVRHEMGHQQHLEHTCSFVSPYCINKNSKGKDYTDANLMWWEAPSGNNLDNDQKKDAKNANLLPTPHDSGL
jgi:hypothetical protein